MLLLLLLQTSTPPLNLMCGGAGVANKVGVVSSYGQANAYGNVGGVPYSGQANGNVNTYYQRQQGFGDQVDVRLFGGDDRIRLPRVMLPPLHGGNDGWFRLKNVVADERSIKAKAVVNFMNSPNIYIDRLSGTIRISGKAGDYSGTCQPVSLDAKPQF